MEMNPQGVRSAAFKTVRKGADPDEVRAFLNDVADELERARVRRRVLGEVNEQAVTDRTLAIHHDDRDLARQFQRQDQGEQLHEVRLVV